MPILSTLAAVAGFFVVADLVYTLDHYFLHHDRARYERGHRRHHERYLAAKNAPQLDRYELATYTRAGVIAIAGMALLSWLVGNWGFMIGAVLKYVHSLVFRCYQHGWRSVEPVRQQGVPRPASGWGLASARYHAHHHANPDDLVFTYAESWQGVRSSARASGPVAGALHRGRRTVAE